MEPDGHVSVLDMREDQTAALQHLGDAELVERARSGERAAFESLFHRHQDRIYTLALAIAGNPSDAKDVVQETFVRAYKKLGSLRGDRGVLAYLRRTATNAAIDVIRARRSDREVSLESFADGGESIADPANGADRFVEAMSDSNSLMEALLSLPDDQRFVVVLHHLEGARVSEIAKILGVPTGTVKSRLGRGRESLRRRMFSEGAE